VEEVVGGGRHAHNYHQVNSVHIEPPRRARRRHQHARTLLRLGLGLRLGLRLDGGGRGAERVGARRGEVPRAERVGERRGERKAALAKQAQLGAHSAPPRDEDDRLRVRHRGELGVPGEGEGWG